MRKCIFIISFLLCALTIMAQDFWRTGFISKNMAFNFSVNTEYRLSSEWKKDDFPVSCLPDEEEDYDVHNDPNIIIWSEGKITYVKDTLICIDSKTHKKIYFFKNKDEDVLQVVKWSDYKNRKEKGNWHLGWNNNPKQKVFIDDLFRESPYFYIKDKRILDKESGGWKVLNVYDWKNGVKRVVYKNKD